MDEKDIIRVVVGFQEEKPVDHVNRVEGDLPGQKGVLTTQDGSDSGHQSSPEKEDSDDDRVLLSKQEPDEPDNNQGRAAPKTMHGISNAGFVDDDQQQGNNKESSNGGVRANGDAHHEIFIPEDAVLNHHSGQVRVKKKKKKEDGDAEKVPMHELSKSVVIPLNGIISEKELKEFANNHEDKQQETTATGDKLAKKPLDEYFIPANTHTKFLRREKLYLTKDKRSPCCGWKRFLVFAGVTVIFAIAVLVGVLAATGVLQAGSGIEKAQTGSHLPHPASMSQNMGPPTTHQLPFTTQHPRRTPTTFLTTLPRDQTITSQKLPIVTSVPTIVPSTIVDGRFTILNRNFTTSLMNNMSQDFQALASDLESKLQEIFSEKEGLVSVKVLQFKQGSIVVEYITLWSKKEDEETVNNVLEKHIQNHNSYLGNYLIKSSLVAQPDNYSSPTSTSSTVTPITRINDDKDSTTNSENDDTPMTTTTNKEENVQQFTTTDKPLTVEASTQGTTTELYLSTTITDSTLQAEVTKATTTIVSDTTTDDDSISESNDSKTTQTSTLEVTTKENATPRPSTVTDEGTSTVTEVPTTSEKMIETTTLADSIIRDTLPPEKPELEENDTTTTDNAANNETKTFETTETVPETKLETERTVTMPTTLPVTENKSEVRQITENLTSTSFPPTTITGTTSESTSSSILEVETSQSMETTMSVTVTSTEKTIKDSETTTFMDNEEKTTDSNSKQSTTQTDSYVVDTTDLLNFTLANETKPSSNITKKPKVVDDNSTETTIITNAQIENATTADTPASTIEGPTKNTKQTETVNETEVPMVLTTNSEVVIETELPFASTSISSKTFNQTELPMLTTISSDTLTETELPEVSATSETVNQTELPIVLTTSNSHTQNGTELLVVSTTSSNETINETELPTSSSSSETVTDSTITTTATTLVINTDLLVDSVSENTDVMPTRGHTTITPGTLVEESTTSIATTIIDSDTINTTYDSAVEQNTGISNVTTANSETTLPQNMSTSIEVEATMPGTSEDIPEIMTFPSNGTDPTKPNATGNLSDENLDTNLLGQMMLGNEEDWNSTFPITDPVKMGLNKTERDLGDDYNETSFFGNVTESSLMLTEDNVTLSQIDGMTLSELENESLVFDEQNGTIFHSSDASNGSNVEGCSVDHFMCPGELECRSLSQKCDGAPDCPDNFDESMCEEDCGLNFRCDNATTCIKATAKCDGVYDCVNGTDEYGCYPTECGQHLVQCLDKSACIRPLNICDGYYNCHDKSDERDCVDRSTCMNTGRFFCSDGLCLPPGLHCDGSKDCSEGEDEENCTCPEHWFQCSDGKCIEGVYQCDGQPNCTDGSDEMECVRVDANNVVEVFNSATNSWAVMCEDSWTFEDGNDLCQELGFSSADSVSHAYIFNNGSSWSTVRNSTDLKNSTYWIGKSHFTNNCSSSKAATVACTKYECGEFRGQNRFLEQWPLVVMIHSLGVDKSCRAEILTPLWLITSAECLQKLSQNSTEWYVQVEQIDLTASEIVSNSTQIREVKFTILHPHSSKFRSPILHDFDMALVRVKDSLDFKNLAAICLPEAEVKPGITCFTGSLAVNRLQGTVPTQMPISFLALTVQARDSCNNPEHYNGWVSSRMLCTENSDANKKLCNNDEAAPLTCYSIDRKWYLAGILTYQRDCGIYFQQPAIYANIFAMRKYIEKAIGMKQYNLTYDASRYIIQDETVIASNATEQPEQNTTVPMYWPDPNLYSGSGNETYIPDSEPLSNNSLLLTSNDTESLIKDINGTLQFQSYSNEMSNSADELIDGLDFDQNLNKTKESNDSLDGSTDSATLKDATFPPIPSPLHLSMDKNSTLEEITNTNDQTEMKISNTNQELATNAAETLLKDEGANDTVDASAGVLNIFQNTSVSSDSEMNVTKFHEEEQKGFEKSIQLSNHSSEHEVGSEVTYKSKDKPNTDDDSAQHVPEGSSSDDEQSQNSTLRLDQEHPVRTEQNSSLLENGIKLSEFLDNASIQLANQHVNPELDEKTDNIPFQCMEVHQTVNSSNVCDGIYNCEDESDEWNCVQMNSSNNVLEVRHHSGKWFPICSTQWDEKIGHRICKQLGYRSSTYTSATRYLETSSSKFFQLSTNGMGDLLQGSVSFSSNCSAGKVVAISCSETSCGSWSVMDEEHHFQTKGNDYAPEKQWPSVAFLINQDRANKICTASILSPFWVITSYSCLIGQETAISATNWNLVSYNTHEVEMKKETSQVEFVVTPQTKNTANIVLVKLASKLSFGHHAICLPDRDVDPGDLCVTAGWTNSETPESDGFNKILQYEQLFILPPNECYENETFTRNRICTGPVNQEERPTIFQASLGAPLMCMSDNRWQLHGILTSKENDRPTKRAYTTIPAASTWIYMTTEQQNILPEIV